MKIGVVGMGYVGVATSLALAGHGHIVCLDINQGLIKDLKAGMPRIHEKNIAALLAKNKSRLIFTTDYAQLAGSQVVFVCVNTPLGKDKRIDLRQVINACKSIKAACGDKTIVVIKSTVVPGSSRAIQKMLGMRIVANPDFLVEGDAIETTFHPDRVVMGSDSEKCAGIVERLFAFTKAPVLKTTLEEAEMIKCSSNAFIALKISYIHEIAKLCGKLGNCNPEIVSGGVGLDHRIGKYFLKPGMSFGGACLPKDIQAFASFAKMKSSRLSLLEDAISINKERPKILAKELEMKVGALKGKRIGVLGLTTKTGTSDTRNSPALDFASLLARRGAKVYLYDPVVKYKNSVTSAAELVSKSELILLNSNIKIPKRMSKNKIVVRL